MCAPNFASTTGAMDTLKAGDLPQFAIFVECMDNKLLKN
jgi:hypothetical protein